MKLKDAKVKSSFSLKGVKEKIEADKNLPFRTFQIKFYHNILESVRCYSFEARTETECQSKLLDWLGFVPKKIYYIK